MTSKTVKDMKAGDVVVFHGGRFRCKEDGRQIPHHLPTPVFACRAECIEGVIRGYFKPGSEWTFQGNHWAVFRTLD